MHVLRKQLFLVTSDFKLLYKIQRIMGEEFQIVHQMSINGGNKSIPFIICTPSERHTIPHHNVLAIHPNLPEISIKGLIRQKATNTTTPSLTIGIDPGHTIGVAILQNDELISTNAIYSVERLLLWIKGQLDQLMFGRAIFKVGHGDPEIRDYILLRLRQEGYHPIFVVNEYRTSVKLFHNKTRHESAAVLIAKREGKLY